MRSKLNSIMAATALGGVIGSVQFFAVQTSKGQSYTAKVGLANAAPSVDICDSKGKVRLFKEMDVFYAEAAKLSVIAPTVESTISNMQLLAPKPFTGDIIKKNEATLAAYTDQKADQDVVVDKVTTEVALLESEATTAPSYLLEKQNQLAGAIFWQTWLGAEIARITAALAPPVPAV